MIRKPVRLFTGRISRHDLYHGVGSRAGVLIDSGAFVGKSDVF